MLSEKKLAHTNDTIITQGTEGDLFYILEEGACEAYVRKICEKIC